MVDGVLVTASLVDVARGAAPGITHGLAAVDLGVGWPLWVTMSLPREHADA